MRSLLQFLRRLWHAITRRSPGSPARRPAPRRPLGMESLEGRDQPSHLPVVGPHDPFLFRPVSESMPLALHIHPHLSIVVDGHAIRIPAGIGLSAAGALPIHTHTTSGIIHIESPKKATFLLSDFFAIWGKTFNRQQILNFHADAHHRITMTVDGHASQAFGNLVLRDGEQIVIHYNPIHTHSPIANLASQPLR